MGALVGVISACTVQSLCSESGSCQSKDDGTVDCHIPVVWGGGNHVPSAYGPGWMKVLCVGPAFHSLVIGARGSG